MTILFSTGALADLNTGLIHYWNLNTDGTDGVGVYDMTAVGTPTHVGGVHNGGIELDVGDYYTNGTLTTSDKFVSINFWLNVTNEDVKVFSIGADGNNLWWIANTNGILGYRYYDDGGYKYNLGSVGAVSFNTFHMLTIVHNDSGNVKIYLDGVLNASTTYAGVLAADLSYIRAGAYHDEFGFNGGIDEVMVWDRLLTSSDVTELWASSAGSFYPFSSTGEVAVTLNSPTDFSVNGTQSINFTFTPSTTATSLDTCLLYTNSSGWSINGTLASPVNNTISSIVLTLDEGDYLWNIYCNDSNANSAFAIANYTFTIDITEPAITSSFSNPVVVWSSNNLTGQINFTDDNLYSMNISVDGTVLFSNYSYSGTELQYNLSYDITSFGAGVHNITAWGCDGHTKKKIDDYDVYTGIIDNEIQYYFNNGGYVVINPEGMWGTFETKKLKDRYNFKYTRGVFADKNNLVFYVTSSSYIDILYDSKYNAHFVILELEKWIDFEIDDATGKEKYEVERISDKKVKVTIKNTKTDATFTFNSIGDLNCNQENYNFNVITTSINYVTPLRENEVQTMSLLVNYTDLTSYIKSNATLTWNGTDVVNITRTPYVNYDYYYVNYLTPSFTESLANVTSHWTFNLYSGSNLTGNITFNQTIQKSLLDNCSSYTYRVLNFTMWRDDIANQLINASMVGYFKLWTTNSDYYSEFNISWAENTQHGVCSFFNDTYNLFAQLEYDSMVEGFEPETYYLYNTTLSNVTQLVDLFLTPNGTVVTFTVNDQNDDEIKDVYIHILKYDFGTNSHVTTEIIKTDENGQALGRIVQNTQWYKFILFYNGLLYLETDPVKITTSTKNFRINLLSDYFEFYDDLNGVSTSLTFTNSTKNFAFTFANPTGTSVTACLKVIKRNTIADTLIEESCTTSASGTILVNIGNNTADNSYIATGRIRFNPDFVTDVLSIDFNEGYKRWGKDGIFVTYLVRLTFAMIGIWNPVVAILLLMIADVSMIVMGLFHMSWTVLITYIILGFLTMWRVNK